MKFVNRVKSPHHFFILNLVVVIWCSGLFAQGVNEYIVKRTNTPITIDGKMLEPQWQAAALTEPFGEPKSGKAVKWNTQAKLLWDDHYLYVGFIADDPDVWSTFTQRDAWLWEEENVEIFCEPNDDRHDYFELEVNPLGTELDILIDKSWREGNNNEDFGWDLPGLKTAVWVDGTLNNPQDTDNGWFCEMAIPFAGIDKHIVTPLHIPPQAGESWRLQLGRYNRLRDSLGNELDHDKPESSLWNKTDTKWFHVPEKFGRIIFSDDMVAVVKDSSPTPHSPNQSRLLATYPNPFNPATMIAYQLARRSHVKINIFDVSGVRVAALLDESQAAGRQQVLFDASGLAGGVYLCQMEAEGFKSVKRLLLLK